MHIHIQNENENIDELLAFCHEMIETSYFPAYCRGAVDMLHTYHNEEAVRSDIREGRLWRAEEEGRLAGTVTVAHGEMSRMFVSPAMRGRGLGAGLARAALDYARQTGVGKLTAWSVPFSRGFYEKLGFVMLSADTLDFNNSREVPVPYIEMALWPEGQPEVLLGWAGAEDAEEIIAGQRVAFEEQCRIYDDWQIPPMLEKSQDVAVFLSHGGSVLKAVSSGRIIGAIRGHVEEGVCHVGRLYVLPERQGLSVARRLISALEESMAGCHTFEIFTGEQSHKNLALYARQGYAPTGRRAPAKALGSEGNYDLVWLAKPNPWPEITQCARRFHSV